MRLPNPSTKTVRFICTHPIWTATECCAFMEVHPIITLIVDFYHKRFHHQNHEAVVNEIRQRFVIPRLRQLLKSVRTRCQQCKILRSMPLPPQTADLPDVRWAAYTRPFTYVYLDYFGPMPGIHCGNGTNFHGAKNELHRALNELE